MIRIEAPVTPATPPIAPAAPDANRPAWLPEQFQSPEDMAKSWKDQQSYIGKLKAGQNQPTPPATPPQAKPDAAEPDAPQTPVQKLDAVGKLDMSKYEKLYVENSRQLPAEAYAELEARGLTKQDVDRYIKGREAEAQIILGQMYEAAGGQEVYEAAIKWSADNLTDGEKKAYNNVLDSNDPEQIMLATSGLVAKFQRKAGYLQPDVVRGDSFNGDAQPFKSVSELKQAMADPRYLRNDKAFHAEVDARLAVSNI